MRRAWLPSKRLVGTVFALACIGACSYDFDQFARDKVASSTGSLGTTEGAGGGTGGSTVAGSAGSTSGASVDTTSSTAATTGSGGAGSGAGGPAGGGTGGSGDPSDASLDAGATGGAAGSPSDAAPGDAIVDRSLSQDAADTGFDCASLQGTVYQGHCYFPMLGPYSWNLAATACPFGSHLVTITSAAEQAIAAQVLANRDRWLGMRRDMNTPNVESSFHWVTIEPFDAGTSYANWDLREGGTTREPNFSGDCVRMQFNSRWADDVCTAAYPALCEHE
jgi:hypothetical protein